MEYWKYKAKDKLQNYLAQKASLESLADDISRLESEAYSIKSATSDGSPVKGGGSRREDRLLSNIVQRQEHELMLERAKKSVSGIERGLGVLEMEERHILETALINSSSETKGVERLMDEYGVMDPSGMYRRINKALLHFTIAMYGGTES